MSTLKLPKGLSESVLNKTANQLHSMAIHLLRAARRRDSESGLTAERLSILSILVYAGSKTVNQLAQIEQVSAPAITRTVKSLEKDAYVIKAKSRDDQRMVYVSATRKSKMLLEELRSYRVEKVAQQLSVLSDTDLQQLAKLLSKVTS